MQASTHWDWEECYWQGRVVSAAEPAGGAAGLGSPRAISPPCPRTSSRSLWFSFISAASLASAGLASPALLLDLSIITTPLLER